MRKRLSLKNITQFEIKPFFTLVFYTFFTLSISLSALAPFTHAEVCTPPQRTGGEIKPPCDDGTTGEPIYGPWLDACQPNYYAKLSKNLEQFTLDRTAEIYAGSDLIWDPPGTSPLTSLIPLACNLAVGENRTNALGQSCGPTQSFTRTPTDESGGGQKIIRLQAPDDRRVGTWAEKSYRMGAWIESLKFFQKQVMEEMQTQGRLSISESCRPMKERLLERWSTLGPLGFKNQPNIEAITSGKDPCLSSEQERALFEEKLTRNPSGTAAHWDEGSVRNRISGCLLFSARKLIETSFSYLANCEIRARAAAVDREMFIAGSACPGSRNSRTSLSDQMIEQRILKNKCESQAQNTCSNGNASACESGSRFRLSDSGCWSCIFREIKTCYTQSVPSFLAASSPALPPAGNYPINIENLVIGLQPGLGIQYRLDPDACTDPTMNQPGCPNARADFLSQSAERVLDELDAAILASKEATSPLQSSSDLDSDQGLTPLQPPRAVEIPLDGVGETLIFGKQK